jgi:GNAT superfamily N-acetyltransferase
MEQLRVRQMSAAEFKSLRDSTISARAALYVQAGTQHPDQAETLAAREIDDLLPAGLQTAGNLFLKAENEDGEYVGHTWVALNRGRPGNAWICDFEISPEYQHKNYSYALAEAAEEQARQHGADTIGGHVYTTNAVMLHAAESAGYQVTSVFVRKQLGRGGR